ncbi:MAG: hypothetical protein AAF705_04060 [Bacteroidota bacterium]
MRRTAVWLKLVFFTCLLLNTSCSSDPKEKGEVESKDIISNLKQGEKVEVTEHQELKKMLPRKLAGMKQIASEGEKAGILGLRYSRAAAEYENDDSWAEVTIIDGGGFAEVINNLADDLSIQVDKVYENEDGYQRNSKIGGYPATEQYDRNNKTGEASIHVGERFLIHLEAEDVSEKQFQKAIKDIDIQPFKKM